MPDPRARLVAALPRGGTAVEVGVHLGDFSALLLEVVAPECLHLVDPWRVAHAPGNRRSWYGADKVTQDEMDARARRVAARFADEVAAGRVVIHRTPSVAAARAVPGPVDLVYLDGDHSRESVAADLAAWWPRLRPDGLLVGDDYRTDRWWGDGVVRAMHDWLGARPDALIELKVGPQIVLRKLPEAPEGVAAAGAESYGSQT